MSVLIALATAAAAGWVIDRLAFRGEFSGLLGDEIRALFARWRQPAGAGPVRRHPGSR